MQKEKIDENLIRLSENDSTALWVLWLVKKFPLM